MKKLIIIRFLAMLVSVIVMNVELFVAALCGFDTYESSSVERLYDLCFSSGAFFVCLFYFFSVRKFHDINLKKLIFVFSVWTIVIFTLSIIVNENFVFLGGGFGPLSSYIAQMEIAKQSYTSGIIGFLFEMTVIVSGIVIGRIENNKTDGKYFIYISKALAIIIAIITFSIAKSITGLIYDIPKMNYLDQNGFKWGFLIALLTAGMWLFYAGFKCFRTNLKIVLPVFLICDVLTIFVWLTSGILEYAFLGGEYGSFFKIIKGILLGKVFWSYSLWICLPEALFITAGVLLGRHFDKKKGLSENIAE